MAALTYPATRYDPSPVVDLASKQERERLSPSALKAFFNIMDHWGVRDEDARQIVRQELEQVVGEGISAQPVDGLVERVVDVPNRILGRGSRLLSAAARLEDNCRSDLLMALRTRQISPLCVPR